MAIVAGVAIDKGTGCKYKLSVEVIQISGGKDTKKKSVLISMEGDTLLDAVRNGISLTGKKLYWSHAKVIILSREIASEGIDKVIDWYMRDSETREDVHLLISEGTSAQEILEGQGTTDEIKSFTLDGILETEEYLSKASETDVLIYDIETKTKGISTVIPAVKLENIDNKTVPQISGSFIIKNDKQIGILNGEETEVLLFIRDEVKGGILLEGIQEDAINTPVSLEVFNNRTTIVPVGKDGSIEINLKIETTVAIDEIEGTENLIGEEGSKKLEQAAANTLKKRIEALVRKVQTQYDADIFKFGSVLREDRPKMWEGVRDHWEDAFIKLKVNVDTKVHIKNSAILSKALEKGD